MTWGKDYASRAREPFEQQWPDLVRGLDNALRVRRVPVSRREDIIQETGLRLFVRWSQLDPDRPVWPFALTIALNLMKDEQRMQARRNASPQRADDVIERGVEEEALARLELNSVQVALQKLTPAQRSVLLADLGELPYDNRAPAALKMLRMRARRTLRSVIDRASALIPVAGLQIRRVSTSFGASFQRNAGVEQAHVVVLSTLGIAGVATIIGTALGIVDPSPRSSGGGPVTVAREVVAIHAPGATSESDGHRAVAGVAHLRAGAGSAPARRSQHRDRGDGAAPVAAPPATLGAGGTGIDEEPSLHSRRFRAWVFAQTVVSGQEVLVDYEVEQTNPACGSPTETGDASRTCLRPEPPRARGRARVVGRPVAPSGEAALPPAP
jgi:DNA-directed RNA polymerase specialized sigma24 family protein